MKKEIDYTGQIFGKWTVIEFSYRNKRYDYFWKCRCECGIEKNVNIDNLKRGISKSCGCQKGKGKNNNNYKHGMRHTRFYGIWKGMKQRCLNKKNPAYRHYGGRGITICDRWLKFENFYDDMYQSYLDHVKEFGEKKTEIDRTENNGNYELRNCDWKNRTEQCNNRRGNNLVTYNNKTLTISQWSKKLNLKSGVLYSRILTYNWSIEKALTTIPIPKKEIMLIAYKGETLTIKQWAKRINIKSDTLYARVQRLNWTIEKSLTTLSKKI